MLSLFWSRMVSIASRSGMLSKPYFSTVFVTRHLSVGGFTDASNKQRIQAASTRAQRLVFLSPSTPSLLELCGQADETLFSAIVGNQYDVLHGLLPPIKP